MKRGLYAGRFQPFHLGHLASVKKILEECDEVVIAIGSTQKSHDPENPFTAGERIEMVYESLKDADLANKCLIVSIPDISNYALWVKHLKTISPRFDVAYSNNPIVKRLFEEEGVAVKNIPFIQRSEFDGTRIRRMMLENKDWKALLPKAVVKVALDAHVVERLREVSKTDKLLTPLKNENEVIKQ